MLSKPTITPTMKVLCAYNANIDAVYRVRGEEIAELITTYKLHPQPEKPPSGSVENLHDFICAILHCMSTGSGREWVISDHELLSSLFMDKCELHMGGNAGIMSNTLAELGAELVMINVARLPILQSKLFISKESVKIPIKRGDDTVLLHPGKAARKSDEELIHFIFEFKAGDRIHSSSLDITAPRENRAIFTWDRPNTMITIDPIFQDAANSMVKTFDGALISGFHLLSDRRSDGAYYVDRINEVQAQIASWKEANEKLFVHAEIGHFSDMSIMGYVLEHLAEVVDSLSMNEDELVMLNRAYGEREAADRLEREVSSESIMDGGIACLERLNLARLCIHTRDFSMSFMQDKKLAGAEETGALMFGSDVAAVFAATGQIKNEQGIHGHVDSLPISNKGIAERDRFMQIMDAEQHGRGAYAHTDGVMVCFSPSRICSAPIRIVGLGDVFTAATFYKELRQSKA